MKHKKTTLITNVNKLWLTFTKKKMYFFIIALSASSIGNSQTTNTSAANTNKVKVATAQPVSILTLSAFSTQASGTTSYLNWSTSKETNLLRFDIERSVDGINFIKIGEKKALGNSSFTWNYVFSDNLYPLANDVNFYYRLKAVGSNGESEYSNFTSVSYFKPAKVEVNAVSPNPFAGSLSVKFAVPEEGEVVISITDAQGKYVKTASMFARQGFNDALFGTDDLPGGVYFVSICSQGIYAGYKIILKS